MVTCKVPVADISNTLFHQLKNKDYLTVSPEFKVADEEFVLVLNANLQISLRDEGLAERLGASDGRLKEQLMADIAGWMGRHVTRLGLVSLPTR